MIQKLGISLPLDNNEHPPHIISDTKKHFVVVNEFRDKGLDKGLYRIEYVVLY